MDQKAQNLLVNKNRDRGSTAIINDFLCVFFYHNLTMPIFFIDFNFMYLTFVIYFHVPRSFLHMKSKR